MFHSPMAVTTLNLERVPEPDKAPAGSRCRAERKRVSLSGVSLQLRAPLEIGFDYTRSLGPTLGAFMTALAERRIIGSRGADGRVHAPPVEYDPVTAAPTAELVEVSDVGTVVTWSW